MRIAPTLRELARAEWNFMDAPSSKGLAGGDYARAEDAAWRRATRELRALLAVAGVAEYDGTSASVGHHSQMGKGSDCRLCTALARLDALSEKGKP